MTCEWYLFKIHVNWAELEHSSKENEINARVLDSPIDEGKSSLFSRDTIQLPAQEINLEMTTINGIIPSISQIK